MDYPSQEPKMFGVYSVTGGIGKSTLSLMTTNVLSKWKKTLLLSFEGAWGLKHYFTGVQNRRLTDLVYSYLAEPEEVRKKHLEEVPKEQTVGAFFLAPARTADEWQELSAEELSGFLNALKAEYPYLVLDFGRELVHPFKELLLGCDYQMLLIDPSEEGRDRMKEAAFELSDLSHPLIYGRYPVGSQVLEEERPDPDYFDLHGLKMLPEEPSLFRQGRPPKKLRKDTEYFKMLRDDLKELW